MFNEWDLYLFNEAIWFFFFFFFFFVFIEGRDELIISKTKVYKNLYLKLALKFPLGRF